MAGLRIVPWHVTLYLVVGTAGECILHVPWTGVIRRYPHVTRTIRMVRDTARALVLAIVTWQTGIERSARACVGCTLVPHTIYLPVKLHPLSAFRLGSDWCTSFLADFALGVGTRVFTLYSLGTKCSAGNA